MSCIGPVLNERPTIAAAEDGRLRVAASFRSPGRTGPTDSMGHGPIDEVLGVGPRRSRVGKINVELRTVSRARAVQVSVRLSAVLMIAPLHGGAEILGEEDRLLVDSGSVGLLVKPGVSTVIWRENTLAAVLHLPRNQLQAAACRRFGQPQRLAGFAFRLDRDPGCDGFTAALDQVLERVQSEQAHGAGPAGDFLIKRTITALERQGLTSEALVVARSVKRAMDLVREGDGPCDAESLATAAGVTARTLRNSFRACLGQSLSAFVQQARLETVRRQLASGRESRSIQALAESADFASATAFARAYLRCFGESPTRTRARAVREGGAV